MVGLEAGEIPSIGTCPYFYIVYRKKSLNLFLFRHYSGLISDFHKKNIIPCWRHFIDIFIILKRLYFRLMIFIPEHYK